MRSLFYKFILAGAFIVTTAIYWPGLYGSFLFDDYPNIVDNHDVQPQEASVPSLVRVALSSPSSEFKRPLASLSFAANYLATGLDPYWMKLTNLIIHLLNGLLVFLLSRSLLRSVKQDRAAKAVSIPDAIKSHAIAIDAAPLETVTTEVEAALARVNIVAALVATSWMLLPINLTAVLYVVQRMESMANLFVLLGLIGYVTGRRRMLASTPPQSTDRGWFGRARFSVHEHGFVTCIISIIIPTAVGILAKETAAMLPLYALLIEWALFRFRLSTITDSPFGHVTSNQSPILPTARSKRARKIDRRIVALFLLVLALPMILGLAWLLPHLLKPEAWATRDFTLSTRLLSESRIVVDYIVWTLIPTPNALSFYHDDFLISNGLLSPWTTLASIVFLAALISLIFWLRPRRPLAALGIALFLGCHLLTGTIIPLELIYEHRNYFASFGLLLAIVPLLAAPPLRLAKRASVEEEAAHDVTRQYAMDAAKAAFSTKTKVDLYDAESSCGPLPLAFPRYTLLTGLIFCWTVLTALTAYAWGNPLRLAEAMAAQATLSPRAQYELARTYIIYSKYDPSSPFTKLAYAPLERAAKLPKATILPEQALIFMNSRMHLPLKDAWWNSMISKLKVHKPGVQDESSLESLTQCAREHHCELPPKRMTEAFLTALSHPNPSARLLAMYGDYAWNVLDDKALGLRMTEQALQTSPNEPAYHITLIRMLAAEGRNNEALSAIKQLETLNIAGRLDDSIAELRALPSLQ
jgi:hypothetical protein